MTDERWLACAAVGKEKRKKNREKREKDFEKFRFRTMDTSNPILTF